MTDLSHPSADPLQPAIEAALTAHQQHHTTLTDHGRNRPEKKDQNR
jgi:hypothetical protein